MALIPVEDNPGLFRDEVSGAIINKNRSDFDIYVSSRKKMRTKAERIETLETKVAALESAYNTKNQWHITSKEQQK